MANRFSVLSSNDNDGLTNGNEEEDEEDPVQWLYPRTTTAQNSHSETEEKEVTIIPLTLGL